MADEKMKIAAGCVWQIVFGEHTAIAETNLNYQRDFLAF
jgi:hypothetical protein